MSSTTLRASLVTALLMIASSVSVALVAESANAAPTYRVNLSVSDTRPEVGEKVRLAGKVRPFAPRKKVLVQGKAAGTGWVTIKRVRLSKRSTYRTSVSFPRAGKVSIRIVKTKTRKVLRGNSPTRRLRVGQAPSNPVIVTGTLPDGTVGTAYAATVETDDNRAGAFTITTGSLPAGLSIDDQRGVISGTPTAAGTSAFIVVFTDADGRSASRAYSISIDQADVAPEISTTTVPDGTVGTAYTTTLETVGDQAGTWAVTTGALPAGLALASATGVISGTPTADATTAFTVTFTSTATKLTDAQALSLEVKKAGPPVIATTTLPDGTAHTAYTTTLTTVGDKVGVWSLTGTLPEGLKLAPATGVISGTPTDDGTKAFTVKFTQTVGGLTDSQALSLEIKEAAAPVISTTSIPAATVSTAYTTTLQTVGNRTGTWTRTAGTLPAGLTLAAATGVISGTPTAVTAKKDVTFRFTDKVTGLTDSQILSVEVKALTAPVISTTSLPPVTINTVYPTQTLKTVGDRAGTWAVTTGALPFGLSLAPTTGVISGTPTVESATPVPTFTVTFTQAPGGLTDTQVLSIDVDPTDAPVISSSTLPGGSVGNAYDERLDAAGRSGTWTVSSGDLPNGLTLEASTGKITGIPTTEGTSIFAVVFESLNGLTDTQSVSITIDPADPPVILTSSLPDGTEGATYFQTLETVGNRAGTWSISSGTLPSPADLSLNPATGVISGTPSAEGTESFTVLFTAAGGLTDSAGFSLKINPAPVVP